MTEQYKKVAIEKLSEILPSFAESLNNLLKSISNKIEYEDLIFEISDVVIHASKVLKTLDEELSRIKEQLNLDENNDETVKANLIKDIDNLYLSLNNSLYKINRGMAMLLLVNKEKRQESEGNWEMFEAVSKKMGIENPTVREAIDNLYKGTKDLTDIIDEIC